MSADIETVTLRQLIDGNTISRKTTGRFVRDDHQRTRLEIGGQVIIYDPIAHQSITLNPGKHQAKVTDISNLGIGGSATPVLKRQSGLPTQTIAGFQTVGIESVRVLPESSNLGNAKPIKRVTTVWYSDELMLPLLTTIVDPLSGNITTEYSNIVVGQTPSADLFSVPDGYVTTYSYLPANRATSPTSTRNPLAPIP